MEITKALANFIANVKYRDLPEEVVKLSKYSFVDTVGITLAGSVEKGVKILSTYIKDQNGHAVASLVGQGFKSTAQNAALVNGTAGDALGFSDVSTTNLHHPSVAVCPAIWALGEQIGSSGQDIILAHIIGVEVSDKIAAGIKSHFYEKGWDPIGVIGTFAATAAAGKILGLDSTKMANALGIAGAQASGTRGTKGTMSKAYRAGRAAENGVIAAKLAQMGFTGRVDIFEIKHGFLQIFADGVDGQKIIENLGNPFAFVSPGITLKPYPSCSASHSAIKGMLTLVKEHGISLEDVESVECSLTPWAVDLLKFPSPQNKFEAKYSMQFCAATALVDGQVAIKSFSDERTKEPKMVDLMRRVNLKVHPELAELGYNPEDTPAGGTVTIKLRSGEEYESPVGNNPWSPEAPPSWNEIIEKYKSCAESIISSEAIENSIEIIRNLEQEKNISRLMDILRG